MVNKALRWPVAVAVPQDTQAEGLTRRQP